MCGVGGGRFSACPTASLALSPVTSPRGAAITLGKNLLNVEYLRSFPERAKKVLHYQIWRKGQQDGAVLTIGIKQRGICLSGSLFDVELGKGSIIETRIASQDEMNEKCSFVDS